MKTINSNSDTESKFFDTFSHLEFTSFLDFNSTPSVSESSESIRDFSIDEESDESITVDDNVTLDEAFKVHEDFTHEESFFTQDEETTEEEDTVSLIRPTTPIIQISYKSNSPLTCMDFNSINSLPNAHQRLKAYAIKLNELKFNNSQIIDWWCLKNENSEFVSLKSSNKRFGGVQGYGKFNEEGHQFS